MFGEGFEDGYDRFQSGKSAGLAAPEGREAKSGETRLQIAKVVLAESEVIEEILNAAVGLFGGLGDGLSEFKFDGGFAKFFEFREKAGDFG